MEDIIPKVAKDYRNNVLVYQANDIETWNEISEPDDALDTDNGFFIQMIENRITLH